MTDFNSSLTRIGKIVSEKVKKLDEERLNGGKSVMTGLETGFTDIDTKLCGLNKSDLIVIAARPCMGKTSFAMSLALGAAKKNPQSQICIFNMEMSNEEMISRIISSEAGISPEAMKTKKISNDEMSEIMRISESLQQSEIYIDDTPSINIMSMKSKLYQMKNLGLVIVDYLQLMTGAGNYNSDCLAEMSEITRDLKILAREFNVPVIVLSQLPRSLEKRSDKRPLLSDLRNSGDIEQHADIVLFLYRKSYYEYYDKNDPASKICECIIAKNRHGETGIVPIGWDGEYKRFYNVEFINNSLQPV